MLPSRDLDEMFETALRLEKLGFDHLRMPDHLIWHDPDIWSPDSWTLLSAIAARTRRLKLSTGVTDPFRRPPAVLAQAVLTLDHLTKGRAVLGIGAGEKMNLMRFGIARGPSAAGLREAMVVVRKLWSSSPSNPVSFQGKVWALHEAYLQIQPFGGRNPPIYVGALGPRTREITGELADGWYPMPAETPETFKQHLKDVEKGARNSGRSLEEIDRVALFGTIVSEDPNQAYADIRSAAAADLLLERTNLEALGYSSQLSRETTIQRIEPGDAKQHQDLFEAIGRVPRELIEKIVLIGPGEDCIKRIEQYLAAGATSFTIYAVGSKTVSTMETYGKVIIPYLREQYSA
jgi:alkanesulfonate monooxygenase SsuD/methylene tetrahydromethanopterin reductase-like flavin-dependent oxidoreductase (luciferase family)